MKLSIITINYNNFIGLEHTIKSVISQTCQNYEYIIIDGGSSDGSVDVIKKYSSRISYWVSEPDNGVYHAMNKGIDVAIGEYCIFMNSGDRFCDNTVIQDLIVNLSGVDVVYGNTHFTNGEIRVAPKVITFKNLYAGSLSHQSTFIRSSLLKKYKYDEKLKIVSDWKFFLQVLILNNGTYSGVNRYVSVFESVGLTSLNMDLFEHERDIVLTEMFPQRILSDMYSFLYGDSDEDKLYIEIKQSRFSKYIYTLNILMLRVLTFFRKGSNWVHKYPIFIK